MGEADAIAVALFFAPLRLDGDDLGAAAVAIEPLWDARRRFARHAGDTVRVDRQEREGAEAGFLVAIHSKLRPCHSSADARA